MQNLEAFPAPVKESSLFHAQDLAYRTVSYVDQVAGAVEQLKTTVKDLEYSLKLLEESRNCIHDL